MIRPYHKCYRSPVRKPVRLGALLNLNTPTNLAVSFNVDTISADLTWSNRAGSNAQYEVYGSTNGGSFSLLGTTIAGAQSYSDATCKQNASVVYKIRVKKGTLFSDYVTATALSTPICWKTNQSTLTAVVINRLIIAAGKSVSVNWGDGTSQSYSGDNTNITKNYAATGQYNITLSGDIDEIQIFRHLNQTLSYGSITNIIRPSKMYDFRINSCGFTGDISGHLPSSILSVYYVFNNSGVNGYLSSWVLPAAMVEFYVNLTGASGALPNISDHATNGLVYNASNAAFSDSNVTVFRKAMTVFNVGNQSVPFVTANIDKLLKAAADWYEVNAPTANCTYTLSGANMGIPTGGASNADITRLVGYYTAAGKTATVIVRTS